ncbi:hypothetical protein GE115_06820 [Agromyces sp. CFH 90414]|uniref:Uncharacterized protein n=1 Tax=Agromyces agglutinans TaxID=2662258 RepID=A0A6I2FCC4_9MICO|nr:hypothetical protein [Agromyces agglutinans]MRG59583.1 hypothetical protein [Agromyces agglutinans]
MTTGFELLTGHAAPTTGARLAAFAAANGWEYRAVGDPPALGDGLWEQVANGTAHDLVIADGWQAGHLRGGTRTAESVRTTKSGIRVTTRVSLGSSTGSIDVGYLAIELPRYLPNMILDAGRNDRLLRSSLARPPRSNQRLSLEGDFDRHFRLYVPKGYERDALYVFTPDLMALLIDETGDLDVEVRDNLLIVMKPGGFAWTEASTWDRFERIRAVVGAKFHDRTDRYADERATGASAGGVAGAAGSANTVAPAGRRLRRKLDRATVIGLAFGAGGVVIALASTVGMWIAHQLGWI